MMSETAVPEMAVSDFVFVGDNRFADLFFSLHLYILYSEADIQ